MGIKTTGKRVRKAANYYPTRILSTGISWMTGGAVFGAYGGGLLLGLKWNPEQLFILPIVPIFIAAIAARLKNRSVRSKMTGMTH
ncbi:hypothetical protein KW849_29230 [Pseudomonas sp. PDM26]|uniref:hypothetical protein n=1 Tax=Pseudomonas sp. PDM26 TaxID=2854766 RepID=UPI001C46C891|nr:hypothetical protein [Pseudomonas sp. PDM26]MBV7550361.1 hypothetical protein [Pseudomonas sp. PDM26]